jgi:DNA-binding response OmpR family regulator
MALPILIVNEEPLLRSFLRKLLSRHGFATIEARDSLTAISTVRETGGNIAALISDVDMPGMGGVELAKTVRSEFPTIPILLMAAIPDWEGDLNEHVSGAEFVHKPFDPPILIQKLRGLLPAL